MARLFDHLWESSLSYSHVKVVITAWEVSVFELFLVRMRENTDQKNSEYGHLLGNEYFFSSLMVSSYVKLFLATCNVNQFTCNDGRCIVFSYKCDNETDCMDGSDEWNCTNTGKDLVYSFLFYKKMYLVFI